MAEVIIKMSKSNAPSTLSIPHTRKYSDTQVEYRFNIPDEEVEKVTTHVDHDFNGCMTNVYKKVEKLDLDEAKQAYNTLAKALIDND